MYLSVGSVSSFVLVTRKLFFFFYFETGQNNMRSLPLQQSACLNISVTQAVSALSAGPLLPPTVSCSGEAPGVWSAGSLFCLLS